MSTESNILFESSKSIEETAQVIEQWLCISFSKQNNSHLFEYSGSGLSIYLYEHNLTDNLGIPYSRYKYLLSFCGLYKNTPGIDELRQSMARLAFSLMVERLGYCCALIENVDELIEWSDRSHPPGPTTTRPIQEGRPGADRNSDRFIDGIPADYKTPNHGLNAITIRNIVAQSIRKRTQAQRIIISALNSGLSKEEAEKGLKEALAVCDESVCHVDIIGEGYHLEGHKVFSKESFNQIIDSTEKS